MKHLRILLLCVLVAGALVLTPRPIHGKAPGPINLTILEAAGDGFRLVVNGGVGVQGATITRVNWDWGDGSSNDSSFPAVHTYGSDGTYTVTATAFDSLGRTASQTVDVTVPLTPVPITLSLFQPEVSGSNVTVNGVVLGGGGLITRVNWNWGDGTSNDSFFPARHTYQTGGTFLVTVTAFDDLGRTAIKTVTLEIRDSDGDGVPDDQDNCPGVPNADQADLDSDGVGDVCDPDVEGDGVLDADDNCPATPNPRQENAIHPDTPEGDHCEDPDADDVFDIDDNCPNTPNADQADSDDDGEGDACDPDAEGDGVLDADDNCPETPNPGQENDVHPGTPQGDHCEDLDADDAFDIDDNCPDTPNADQADSDGDSVGDVCEPGGGVPIWVIVGGVVGGLLLLAAGGGAYWYLRLRPHA